MRKFLGSSLLVGAAAGAIALSAPAAFASSTWTVVNSNSDGHFAATLKSGTTVTFKDVTTNQPFTCTASSLTGTAKSGTGLPGAGIATNSGSFSGCTGNFGARGTATLSGSTLNADSYASPTTTGHITNVSASLAISDLFGSCNATVSGTVAKGTYTNGTGEMTIYQDPAASAGLTVTSATGSGCAGLINTGDKTVFGATYLGTDPSPPITITSP